MERFDTVMAKLLLSFSNIADARAVDDPEKKTAYRAIKRMAGEDALRSNRGPPEWRRQPRNIGRNPPRFTGVVRLAVVRRPGSSSK